MVSGTFNHIKKIGPFIIKISKKDELSKKLKETFDSKNVRLYKKDIQSVGIKTPIIILDLTLFDIDISIQEFIKGSTIQDFLYKDYEISEKLKIIRQFLELYNNSKKNPDLCLDWNLKNFIIKDDIYYIDFVPCLYLNKIKNIDIPQFEEYKKTYIDEQIQVLGIASYMLLAMFENVDKYNLINILESVTELFKQYTGIDILNIDKEHVYSERLKLIVDYARNDLNYEDLTTKIKKYSIYKEVR